MANDAGYRTTKSAQGILKPLKQQVFRRGVALIKEMLGTRRECPDLFVVLTLGVKYAPTMDTAQNNPDPHSHPCNVHPARCACLVALIVFPYFEVTKNC